MRFFDIKHTVEAETSWLNVLQYRDQMISHGPETQFAFRKHKQGFSVHESLHFSLFQSSVISLKKKKNLNSLTLVLMQIWHNIIK